MTRTLLAFNCRIIKQSTKKYENKASLKLHEPPRLNVANCKHSKMSHKNLIVKAKRATIKVKGKFESLNFKSH